MEGMNKRIPCLLYQRLGLGLIQGGFDPDDFSHEAPPKLCSGTDLPSEMLTVQGFPFSSGQLTCKLM